MVSDFTYARVTVTDHRADPQREIAGVVRWRDARERRCAVAGFASSCFTSGQFADPQIEVHWGKSEWAPAQVFIADRFVADVEMEPLTQETFEDLSVSLAARTVQPFSYGIFNSYDGFERIEAGGSGRP